MGSITWDVYRPSAIFLSSLVRWKQRAGRRAMRNSCKRAPTICPLNIFRRGRIWRFGAPRLPSFCSSPFFPIERRQVRLITQGLHLDDCVCSRFVQFTFTRTDFSHIPGNLPLIKPPYDATRDATLSTRFSIRCGKHRGVGRKILKKS